jgi:hypothetical protein
METQQSTVSRHKLKLLEDIDSPNGLDESCLVSRKIA